MRRDNTVDAIVGEVTVIVHSRVARKPRLPLHSAVVRVARF